jgi:rhodanese-related sulfurtransferase
VPADASASIPVTQSELLAFASAHPYLSLALAGLTVAIIVNEVTSLFRGYKGLGPAQLTALVNQDNALVVDLRPQADFEKGHIPGSKNVQMSQFDPENKQLAAARALPVVLVCKSGQTAASAAGRLHKAGFERVYVLDGGVGAWQQADLPLARGR